jgi:hypothetical protein
MLIVNLALAAVAIRLMSRPPEPSHA